MHVKRRIQEACESRLEGIQEGPNRLRQQPLTLRSGTATAGLARRGKRCRTAAACACTCACACACARVRVHARLPARGLRPARVQLQIEDRLHSAPVPQPPRLQQSQGGERVEARGGGSALGLGLCP
eukprot:6206779-Pleurochrysis_carterae.AAC.1